MSWILFNENGMMFLLRWFHYLSGVTWIGLLYYFNFAHGSYMAEADAAAKPSTVMKLLPRVLWWFRWGAMMTLLTGAIILTKKISEFPSFADFLATSYGITISIGAIFGITMWANVWFIIWPKQKIVIKSATQVAGGGAALPEVAAAAARAGVASKTNTVFSIPMLFFMGAASHLPLAIRAESKIGLMWTLVLLFWAGFEINAIKGKVGYMNTVKNTIIAGFLLMAAIYIVLEVCL